MNKNKVYELFYKIISESMEWASEYGNYHKYVDGAVNVVKEMINFIDENCKTNNEDSES